MYKLIFVDDEAIVRDGISSCIPWGENGFVLSGLFENGLQVLDYLENNHADVVISDINMPRMDGLSLSRELEKKYPEIMVLLLSGYDEFEYAQEALKSKVREFLLKPITAQELTEVLLRIEKELLLIKNQKEKYAQMQDKLKKSFPLLKDRFLYRLVSGKLELKNILKRKEYFQWNDMNAFYQVSNVYIPEDWNEVDRITFYEYLKNHLDTVDELFTNRSENIVVLFQGEEKDKLKNRSRYIAEKIYEYAFNFVKEQISVGCGEVVDSTVLIPSSYRGAVNSLNYSNVLGMSQILSIEDLRVKETISPEVISEKMLNLSDQLKTGDRNSCSKAMEAIFLYLENRRLSPIEVAFYSTRLHLVFLNFIQDIEMFSENDDTEYYQPQNFNSIITARKFFSQLLNLIEDKIVVHRDNAARLRLEKAKNIIEKRKGDNNFSLQEICNEVFLSVSQFSLIFKTGTGKTFIEYLTMCRIEEAKKLLKTSDLKSYEIAEKTGFTDPRYFSILFKKTTAMTPMEYRRSLSE